MPVELGPVLHVEESTVDLWRFSVHVMVRATSAAPPALSLRVGAPAKVCGGPELVADHTRIARLAVWCWTVECPRAEAETLVSYEIVDSDRSVVRIDDVAIPSRHRLPRIAFFSCSGFSSFDLARQTKEPFALWRAMHEEHRRGVQTAGAAGLDDRNAPSAIHVLVGGGDQVYADSLEVLKDLDRLSASELARKRSAVARYESALLQYLKLYVERWRQTEMATMLARVPGVFTWDDHDIFDGWGSHDARVQQNEAYGDVFRAARDAFQSLQLGGGSGGRAPALVMPRGAQTERAHFLQTLTLSSTDADLSIVVLDERSNRTQDEVLGATQWSDLKTHLASQSQTLRTRASHTLVVSSIPVVHLRFKAVTWILERLVPGVQEIEDDLRDQWEHPDHLGERTRLIHTLLNYQRDKRTRVTILSGDVHVGALGCIESVRPEHQIGGPLEPARITQITSSGIVHPSPNGWQRWFLELLGAEGRNEVDAGITTAMLPIDSRTERLWTRNFLLLDVDRTRDPLVHQLWARYVAEDRQTSRMITIPSPAPQREAP